MTLESRERLKEQYKRCVQCVSWESGKGESGKGRAEKGRAVKERCENSTRFPLDKFSPVAHD